MKYLDLVYGEESKLATISDKECLAYDAALRKSGQCLDAEDFQLVQTATVRVRNGKVSITDGPFAETKEQLAGVHQASSLPLRRRAKS